MSAEADVLRDVLSRLENAARSLVEASLPPGLDERERRRRICERFYGVELANRVFPSMKKESP